MPQFDQLPEPQFKKKVSEVQFESSDEQPNLFGIDTDAAFAMRFTSYFFVRAKGTYKVKVEKCQFLISRKGWHICAILKKYSTNSPLFSKR